VDVPDAPACWQHEQEDQIATMQSIFHIAHKHVC
jgi:hypothetical protein